MLPIIYVYSAVFSLSLSLSLIELYAPYFPYFNIHVKLNVNK